MSSHLQYAVVSTDGFVLAECYHLLDAIYICVRSGVGAKIEDQDAAIYTHTKDGHLSFEEMIDLHEQLRSWMRERAA